MGYIDRDLLQVSLGKQKADIILSGAKVVNVYSRSVSAANVAIHKNRIAAVGDVEYLRCDTTEIVDVSDKYLVPGLIDPHIHPEVSKLSLLRFAEAALSKGTTSIFCAFDQVGVVAGVDGIRFCLDEMGKTALKVFHSGPSRLPYTTPSSTVGFSFHDKEHERVAQWAESNGMWETMVESIENLEEPVLSSADFLHRQGRLLHGHLPFTFGPQLQAAAAAGIRDDHESWSPQEVIQKVGMGIYALLRKASCVDNIRDCLKAVTELDLPSRYVALCTDDVDASDLVEHGYMDFLVRYAISLGVDPVTAIQMCTINAAESARVDHLVGSLTPGRFADVLVVGDLTQFAVEKVFASGQLVVDDGKLLVSYGHSDYPESFSGTMKLDRPVVTEDIFLAAPVLSGSTRALVMQLLPSQVRVRREADLPVEEGMIQPDPSQDVCYISVTDRYSGEGKTSSGFIGGFGLQRGAFATSLSPDDDNVICIGASVADMTVAINRLFELDGGQIVVCDGKVTAELPLPICGIMADLPINEMAAKEKELEQVLASQGVSIPKPFFSQIFLSITAIPEFAITDAGFVSYKTKDYINPILDLEEVS